MTPPRARRDPRLDWWLARAATPASSGDGAGWITALWFLRPDLDDEHPDWRALRAFVETAGIRAAQPVPPACPVGARVLRVRVPVAALPGLQAQPALADLVGAMPQGTRPGTGPVGGAPVPRRLPPGPAGGAGGSAQAQAPGCAPPSAGPSAPRVVTAVIDDACPWTHPALARRDAPQRTRVAALWRMAAPDGRGPADQVWEGDALDRARAVPGLLAHSDARRARGLPADGPPVPAADAHGVPVWQLAAGHGPTPLGGLGLPDALPDLPLLGVLLSPATVADLGGGGLTGELVEALRWTCTQAAARAPGAALVVTIAYGLHAGPHDGSAPFERALAQWLAAWPGLHVVLAAGNGQRDDGHARATLTPGTPRRLGWQIAPDHRRDSLLELWLPPGRAADLSLRLRPPAGGPALVLDLDAARRVDLPGPSGRPLARVDAVGRGAGGAGDQVLLAVAATRGGPAGDAAPAGGWIVELTLARGAPAELHARVERDGRARGQREGGRPSRLTPLGTPGPAAIDPDRQDTVNGLATLRHPRVVVVGALQAGDGRPSAYAAAGAVAVAATGGMPGAGPGGAPGAGAPMATAAGPAPTWALPGDRGRLHAGLVVGGRGPGGRATMGGSSVAAALGARLLSLDLAAGRPLRAARDEAAPEPAIEDTRRAGGPPRVPGPRGGRPRP